MSNNNRNDEVLNLINSVDENVSDMIKRIDEMRTTLLNEIEFELYALNSGTGEGNSKRYLNLNEKYYSLCSIQSAIQKAMVERALTF